MKIKGNLGSTGFDLNFQDAELTGRIGGRFTGEDLNLTVGKSTHGRIGGDVLGFDIRGFVSPQRIQVRVGGGFTGLDVNLKLEGNRVNGRYGSQMFGKDVALSRRGNHIAGQVGGRLTGVKVKLFSDAPLEVIALCVAVVQMAAEMQQ